MTLLAEPAAVAIRPAGPGDLGYVLKTTLRQLWATSHLSRGCEKADFMEGEQVVLKRHIERGTLVAHPPEDPSIIAGFVIFQPLVCHYVYVRAGLRGQGIGRALMQAAKLDPTIGFTATCDPYDRDDKGVKHDFWARAKYPAIHWNAYPRWN